MPLTVLKAKSLSEPGRHADGKGLFLHVRESGTKAWVLRIQVAGKRRDFGIGSFDEISLADAREKAADYRRQFKNGVDPAAAKVAEIDEAKPSFRQAAKMAYDEQRDGWRNDKHRVQWLSSLETYAFPYIGDMPVDEVTAAPIRDLLARIWLSKPETARRVRQRVGAVLDWAHAKEYRTSEAPIRSINKGLPRQPKKDRHHEALPYDLVPALITKLSEVDSVGRLALQFAILTAARSGEVRLAVWREIDFEAATWTIPGDRMKAGKTHIVPLSDPAISVLTRVKEAFGYDPATIIFPGQKKVIAGLSPRKPLSDMTLLKALRDNWAGTITVHGFRSSFRDWAAEQTNTPGDVVEAALAHAVANRVEAAYRRTNYLEKRRLLMDLWATFISGNASATNGQNGQ